MGRVAKGYVRLAGIAMFVSLAAAPAHAVDVKFTAQGLAGCTNVTSGVASCDTRLSEAGDQVTVTWSLTSTQTLNGFDFAISWDAEELTLLSCQMLYPDTQPPGTVPFFLSPCDANDPEGSDATAVSSVGFQSTALFSLTFEMTDFVACDTDGLADLTWTPYGNGLSPGSVVLTNPGGASADMSVPLRECNDGLDNDNDGFKDFDGGVCAGLPPAEQTAPDAQCAQPLIDKEKKQGRACGLGFELGLLLPLLAWRRARRRREA
jgi:hypothetical protein